MFNSNHTVPLFSLFSFPVTIYKFFLCFVNREYNKCINVESLGLNFRFSKSGLRTRSEGKEAYQLELLTNVRFLQDFCKIFVIETKEKK